MERRARCVGAGVTHGLIRSTAALAEALPGREAGDRVPSQGAEAELVSIEP
jgi:hypothetical protein